MSQTQAAAAVDRLPWLPDEPNQMQRRPQTKRRGGNRDALLWAFAAMLVVATYWMVVRNWGPQDSPQTEARRPGMIVSVPQPRAAEPQQPQVMFERTPQVSPAPLREVPIARPRAVTRSVERQRGGRLTRESPSKAVIDDVVSTQNDDSEVANTAPAAEEPAAKADSKPLTTWPATQSQGAKGRIVRVGAFGSRQQAKLGWRHMVRAYPAVAHLKATVVSDRNSRGRYFYRFQIGTTSQAHSEVLCQRMEKIRLSCAVVGLPWKPRGVER
jgi:hypothetical protein